MKGIALRPTVAVGAVVVARDARVLLVRRARPPLEGSWSLPGGRVEAGETFEHATVREVQEETGLKVCVRESLGVVRIARESFCYEIHEFFCSLESPERDPLAGDDAAEVRWAEFVELEGLGTGSKVIAVVRRALRVAAKGKVGRLEK